ncbi:TadE-like protein [Salinihabitans flavidus]|uniref:TadE-like protein n=1 Tax=Salinihabitans flavidus TaxID=569882 RepID=A0A1H8P296_9RHOB|nr:TadE/TadG family type IV pilus assembly protein [Salinihabitans flavidus]SEO35992.1 TadE-like protein [Salinihabitans flavidus]
MSRRPLFRSGRLARDERGHATVEFVIIFPIFLVIMLSAIELGLMTMRYSLLERALDLTVREVRLSTGFSPDHDELKQMICDEFGMLPNCFDRLALEMIQVSPRAYVEPSSEVTCNDLSLESQPVTTFTPGMDNDLMLLRACAKFTPLFPNTGFGLELAKDGSGDVALVSMSAFVQEPR